MKLTLLAPIFSMPWLCIAWYLVNVTWSEGGALRAYSGRVDGQHV